MGANSSLLTREVGYLFSSSLDENVSYRYELLDSLRQYDSDPQISASESLQWTAEKLIKDFLDPHKFGSQFVPALNALLPANTDRLLVNDSIAKAAMVILQELKVDLDVHRRLLDISRVGNVTKLMKIRKFVDLNWVGDGGETALLLAAEGGHFEAVKYLLFECGAECDSVNQMGWSCFMWASYWGWSEVVYHITGKLSVDSVGIELLSRVNDRGESALILASQNGHFAIVRHLIELRFDVHLLSRAGENALLAAVRHGHESCAKALVEAGAVIDQLNHEGQSAILLAAVSGQFSLVSYLVSFGARLDFIDSNGKSICDFEQNGKLAAAIQRGFSIRIEKIKGNQPKAESNRGKAKVRKPAFAGRKIREKTNKTENRKTSESESIDEEDEDDEEDEEFSTSSRSPDSENSSKLATRPRRRFRVAHHSTRNNEAQLNAQNDSTAAAVAGAESDFSDADEELLLDEAEREMRKISQRGDDHEAAAEAEKEADQKNQSQNAIHGSALLAGAGFIVNGEDSEEEENQTAPMLIKPWKANRLESNNNNNRRTRESLTKSNEAKNNGSDAHSDSEPEAEPETRGELAQKIEIESATANEFIRINPFSLPTKPTPISDTAKHENGEKQGKPHESTATQSPTTGNQQIPASADSPPALSSSTSVSSASSSPSSVVVWLRSRGFDSAAISILSEFNLNDLYSLEDDDAIEMLGIDSGQKLVRQIKADKAAAAATEENEKKTKQLQSRKIVNQQNNEKLPNQFNQPNELP